MKRNPFERLPDTVKVGGVQVRINPDVRVGVSIETEMLQEHPDVEGLLDLFYPVGVPQPIEEAAEQMIRFYAGEKEEENGEVSKMISASKGRIYDFSLDADALTASFAQAYGIDLEHDLMHWWKFRRLMFGLPADTSFVQRIHIRSVDINKVDKSQKGYYRKMKKLYAIRQPEKKRKMTAEKRNEQMRQKVAKRFEEAQAHAEN